MHTIKNKYISYKDFGFISYAKAWEIQKRHQQYILSQKQYNRDSMPSCWMTTNNYLMFCEHNPVYTLGKNGNMQNLLLSNNQLNDKKIEFFHIERGGDITYHGPGQITGYPIIDLENFFTDLHVYLRKLEEAIIRTILHWGIIGTTIPGLTGVWIDQPNQQGNAPRKIAAIGIKCSRWVTMHGFALNVNTNLNYFRNIIPCAINDKEVTSIEREIGKKADVKLVKKILLKEFASSFSWHYLQ